MQKKEIRKLLTLAYQRELDKELQKLYQHFKNWEKQEINCFDLNDLIHEFYKGPRKEVYKLYNYSNMPTHIIAHAVAYGILKKEELSQECLKEIESTMIFFKDDLE